MEYGCAYPSDGPDRPSPEHHFLDALVATGASECKYATMALASFLLTLYFCIGAY